MDEKQWLDLLNKAEQFYLSQAEIALCLPQDAAMATPYDTKYVEELLQEKPVELAVSDTNVDVVEQDANNIDNASSHPNKEVTTFEQIDSQTESDELIHASLSDSDDNLTTLLPEEHAEQDDETPFTDEAEFSDAESPTELRSLDEEESDEPKHEDEFSEGESNLANHTFDKQESDELELDADSSTHDHLFNDEFIAETVREHLLDEPVNALSNSEVKPDNTIEESESDTISAINTDVEEPQTESNQDDDSEDVLVESTSPVISAFETSHEPLAEIPVAIPTHTPVFDETEHDLNSNREDETPSLFDEISPLESSTSDDEDEEKPYRDPFTLDLFGSLPAKKPAEKPKPTETKPSFNLKQKPKSKPVESELFESLLGEQPSNTVANEPQKDNPRNELSTESSLHTDQLFVQSADSKDIVLNENRTQTSNSDNEQIPNDSQAEQLVSKHVETEVSKLEQVENQQESSDQEKFDYSSEIEAASSSLTESEETPKEQHTTIDEHSTTAQQLGDAQTKLTDHQEDSSTLVHLDKAPPSVQEMEKTDITHQENHLSTTQHKDSTELSQQGIDNGLHPTSTSSSFTEIIDENGDILKVNPNQSPIYIPKFTLSPMALHNELAACSTLEELRALCEKHRDLLKTDLEHTNLVFGVGNPQAKLMIVGEAPGENEDIQGEPFVGRAGQLLDKIMAAINFQRSDIYIANILKHRPPKNRDPLPDERDRSLPFLLRQIELIQPKIVLCMGRISAKTLLGLPDTTTLAQLRGKFHPFLGKIELTATYHPAALLRNPNWKRPTWEDVQMVRKRYDELVN